MSAAQLGDPRPSASNVAQARRSFDACRQPARSTPPARAPTRPWLTSQPSSRSSACTPTSPRRCPARPELSPASTDAAQKGHRFPRPVPDPARPGRDREPHHRVPAPRLLVRDPVDAEQEGRRRRRPRCPVRLSALARAGHAALTRASLATLLPVDSGFLLGPILALRLGAAFVPVRKAGKLVRRAESCGAGWTRGY